MNQIFLVDDHPTLRQGLHRLIAQIPTCQITGQAASAADALTSIPQANPDLVVLDITLPDRSGLDLVKDLHVMVPIVKILVFSMHDEMLYAERVIRAGAKGYLMKGASSGHLSEAIERILGGGIYLSPRVSNQILQGLTRSREGLGLGKLTDRELEVFELIGRGRSTAQISDQLHISPKTVDAHRFNLKTKLSLADAPSVIREAVLWVEFGSANLPPPNGSEDR